MIVFNSILSLILITSQILFQSINASFSELKNDELDESIKIFELPRLKINPSEEEQQCYEVLPKLFEHARRGNAKAQYEIGLLYETNQVIDKNLTQAAHWYKKSAKQEYSEAQLKLAMLYHKEGLTQDLIQSFTWFRKAADQNNKRAQFYLGIMYQDGQGIDQDLTQAINWYTKAAEQGHAAAQFNLASMYQRGEGTDQDLNKAIVWYTKAADQEMGEAQNNLSLMYKKGEGVDKDLEKALIYAVKAFNNGYGNTKGSMSLFMHGKMVYQPKS